MDHAAFINALLSLLGGLGGTVVILMPGYILGKVYSRGVKAPELTGTAFIAASAIGGVVTHLAMLGWTIPLAHALISDAAGRHGRGGFLTTPHYVQAALWIATTLLVAPAVLGFVFALVTEATSPSWLAALLKRLGLSAALRTGEAWNWKFRALDTADEGLWLRITLKGGQGVLVGKFGRRSLASSDPRFRDLYVEELWTLDARVSPRRLRGRGSG